MVQRLPAMLDVEQLGAILFDYFHPRLCGSLVEQIGGLSSDRCIQVEEYCTGQRCHGQRRSANLDDLGCRRKWSDAGNRLGMLLLIESDDTLLIERIPGRRRPASEVALRNFGVAPGNQVCRTRGGADRR